MRYRRFSFIGTVPASCNWKICMQNGSKFRSHLWAYIRVCFAYSAETRLNRVNTCYGLQPRPIFCFSTSTLIAISSLRVLHCYGQIYMVLSRDRNSDFFRDLILMEVSELNGIVLFIARSVCKQFDIESLYDFNLQILCRIALQIDFLTFQQGFWSAGLNGLETFFVSDL